MEQISAIFSKCVHAFFHHYALHEPEHVGQFAGSLLPLSDWQH
jgi:hypothetical protein